MSGNSKESDSRFASDHHNLNHSKNLAGIAAPSVGASLAASPMAKSTESSKFSQEYFSNHCQDSPNAHELKSVDSAKWLCIGVMHFEKCELKLAKEAFQNALRLAELEGNRRTIGDSILRLLRIAGEALNRDEISTWEARLEQIIASNPSQAPIGAFYCRGVIAWYQQDYKQAQRLIHQDLKNIRHTLTPEDPDYNRYIARSLTMLANVMNQLGRRERARLIGHSILARYEKMNLRGINGVVHLMLGNIDEKYGRYKEAWEHYQNSQMAFLQEHNWYFYLYVLYGYARLSRLQKNYKKAYWYLDLVDKSAAGEEFGLLRLEVNLERKRLEDDAVDLLIDASRGVVTTRDTGAISLRKQYILLDILKALSQAHEDGNDDSPRGLSKAELIGRVWREDYRPEAHDNKLYYNINRLRKLIEPNARQPRYLLNWKEGYRLAPGLRIHFVNSGSSRSASSSPADEPFRPTQH